MPGAPPRRHGMLDMLGYMFRAAFGLALVSGLLFFVYKRFAADWEDLVSVYGRPWQPPRILKRFANLVVYSEERPPRTYKGIVSIGLYEDGIGLRPNRWLAPFHEPVFLPYDEIKGWRQYWYLDSPSVELSLRRAPSHRLIMPKKQVEWLTTISDEPIPVSPERPPHGGPWVSRGAAILLGLMTVAMVVMLAVRALA